MSFPSKPIVSGLLVIGVLIAGVLFLVRGCLSRYDERAALPYLLYFEKKDQQLVFSLVKFEKAISYSRNGGFINKSVNTDYYIQTNEAVTGKKIKDRKIKGHRDIKHYPVEILGVANNSAWVYMDEPMAFDPFTLETIADISILEQKNPILKGKFPGERKYYRFDPDGGNIYFTALDGSGWKLDTKSLRAIAADEVPADDAPTTELRLLERSLKLNQAKQDCLYAQKSYRPSRQLSAHEITNGEYNRLTARYYEERTLIYNERDSLQVLKAVADKNHYYQEDILRRKKTLNESSSLHFNQMKVNADTAAGNWYGLYSKAEIDKLNTRFAYSTSYDETARRQLYSGISSMDRSGDILIHKEQAVPINNNSYYLDGGLLLDRETGKPFHTGDAFLVISKNMIGAGGRIQLSRVGKDGKITWTLDTQLKEWTGYLCSGKRMFITGTDNKELSSGDSNVLLCIDLGTGKPAKYDFFTDK